MGIPLLNDIIIIFALAIAVIYFCQKLSIPSVVGFLLTGVLAGPYGLGLVNDVDAVEAMAELGIILLLFTIGIEFSLGQLMQIKRSVLLGGSLQVFLTISAVALIMIKLGFSIGPGVFVGCLLALSSTAIVLKVLQDRSEVDTPHGRNVLGILIFQDLIIIPMMLLTPLLANNASSSALSLSSLMMLGKVVLVMGLVYVSARWLAPYLLQQIARQQNRELFLISIVTMGLAVAWMTSSIGLSLSLGAFLAGLIISESEYSHQALGSILPFRDVFTSIFFVSVGMLFNLPSFAEHPLEFTGAALAVLTGKSIFAAMVVLALGYPLRTAILSGMALGQVGEFAFILSSYGVDYGLLNPDFYKYFIIVSVLTMALTPFIINLAPVVANWVLRLPLPASWKSGAGPLKNVDTTIVDHLVIIGFGVNGRNLARAATASGIPYAILEMNPDLVGNARREGEPVYFGDATQPEVLKQANITAARVAVVAISDAAATIRICDLIRRISPEVHLIVRTRYIQEIEGLYRVGANEVIPEEFETSIEIFTLVLRKYLVPRVDIENFISEVRSDGYEMLRSLSKKSPNLNDIKLHFHGAEITNLRLEANAPAAGKTLAEIELRSKYGVSLLLIQRGSETIINPDGDTALQEDDQAVLLGTPELINSVTGLFVT